MDGESLSQKYKKFVGFGFLRVFVSRMIAIFSIAIMYRLIDPSELGTIFAISSGLVIISRVTDFGVPWSMRQRGLAGTFETEQVIRAGVFLMFRRNIPLAIIIGTPFYIYARFDSFHLNELLMLILFLVLNIVSVLVKTIEDMRLRPQNPVIVTTIYSIATSVTVPLFFYISPSVLSVFFAWTFSVILSVLPFWKTIIEIFGIFLGGVYEKEIYRKVFSFGFPLFLFGIPNVFANEFEIQLVFNQLDENLTSKFYAANRLISVATEIVRVVLTGIFPLLASKVKTDPNRARRIFISGIRIYSVIALSTTLGIFLNASWVVPLLYDEGNRDVVITVYLLSFSILFNSVAIFTYSYLNAKGLRRKLVYSFWLALGGKVVFELLLLPYGINGIAAGSLISNIVLIIFIYFLVPEVKRSFPIRSRMAIYLVAFPIVTLSIYAIFQNVLQVNDLTLGSFIYGIVPLNLGYLLLSYVIYRLVRPLVDEDRAFLRRFVPRFLHAII